MSSTIYTIPPNLPLIREACGKALPCIATQSYILDALNYTLVILNKWVRNFDAVSYHRGNPNRISSFYMVAGGGLMSSTIFTIPPNLPLIREACGKAAPCIAAQSYILNALNYTLKILNKWVRNFDAVSYHRGNPSRIPSFLW